MDRWTNEVWLFRYTLYGAPVENSRQLARDTTGTDVSTRAARKEIVLTRTTDILVMVLILWMLTEFLRRGINKKQ